MSQGRRRVGTPINIDDRNRPIKDAETSVNKLSGVIGSIALAILGVGALGAIHGNNIEALWGALLGVVNAAATFGTGYTIRRVAEPKVTPMSDPRDNELRPLSAATPGSRLVNAIASAGTEQAFTNSRPGPEVNTRRSGPLVDMRNPARRGTDDRADRRRDTGDGDGDGGLDPLTVGMAAGIYGTTPAPVAEPAPAQHCTPPAAADTSSSAPADTGGHGGGYGGSSSDSSSCGGGQ